MRNLAVMFEKPNYMSNDLHALHANEYIIYDKGEFIQVHANGAKTLAFTTAMWHEVVKRCKANKVFKILGIALTSDPLSENEAVGLLPVFKELGLDKNYKIAWVELNPEFYDVILFSEQLLASNGVDAKFFYEVSNAQAWLLKDQ